MKPLRLLMVAGFPPPSHGSANMNAQLREVLLEHPRIDLTTIRLGRPKTVDEIGKLSIRSLSHDGAMLCALAGREVIGRRWHVAYLAISQRHPALLRDMIVWWLLSRLADRVIVHVHGGELPDSIRRDWLRRALAKLASRTEFWILSERLGLSAFRTVFPDARGIEVVPNATACSCAAASKAPIDGEIRIGYLGTVHPDKGVDTLLEGVRRIAEDRSLRQELTARQQRVQLQIAGPARSPGFLEVVRSQCSAISSAGAPVVEATYLGPISRDARCSLLSSWDAIALISRYELEGQPLALIEGAAHQCAIVCNDYRALADINVDGRTGWIVDGRQEASGEDVERVLRKILQDPSVLRDRGSRALDLARERFTQQAFEARVEELLLSRDQR
jgi:glycosyltransferase involved in cell wall biosynthesis